MPATFEPFPITDAQKAYEETPEFAAYWQAWEVWSIAHNAYAAAWPSKKDALRPALIQAAEEKARLLEIARKLPIHKEAFGW